MAFKAHINGKSHSAYELKNMNCNSALSITHKKFFGLNNSFQDLILNVHLGMFANFTELMLNLFIYHALHGIRCKPWAHSFLLLGSILLTKRCRTDDSLPDLPVLCLPQCHVDSKVLGLNVIVDRSQPGGSWTARGSPPVRWWSQCGRDDTAMVFLLGWPSQVPEELSREHFTLPKTGEQPVILQTVSFVVCLVYGIRKILHTLLS